MNRFDKSSKRLLFGTTLLAAALLAIPIAKSFVDARQPDEMWKTGHLFTYRTTVTVDASQKFVRTYDGINLAQFDFATGKRQWTRAPKRARFESAALTPDGLGLVGIESGQSGQELVVRNAKTGAIEHRVELKGSRTPNVIHFVDKSHAILSESGIRQEVRGVARVLNFKTGEKLFSEDVYRAGDNSSTAFATFGRGIYKGYLDDDGPTLRLNTPDGKAHKLLLDILDAPNTQRPDYGYFFPTTIFDAQQQRVFSSIQYRDSINDRVDGTGSVCAWNWQTGARLWRWKENAVQPVTIALSPDQKLLAVGGTRAIQTSYRRGVSLVILEAATGKKLQEIKRDRGGSARWQRAIEKVRKTPDEFFPSGYNVPTITGLAWAGDSRSLVVAYADGDLIRWRIP